MLKVGITGGISSGKTTVCKIFEVLGIPVFYADDAAKAIMNTEGALISGIKEVFGELAYVNNELNRKYLAGIVFKDAAQLARLNALVHPAVFRVFDAWAGQHGYAPYILKEAALLFESGSDKLCDKTILVTAPQPIKIKRAMQRDKISEEEVLSRINKQFTDEKKRSLADFEIENDEKHLLIPQVLKLHELFLSSGHI